MRSRRPLPLPFVVLLAACSSADEHRAAPPPAESPPQAGPEDGAASPAIVVAVWPERWKALTATSFFPREEARLLGLDEASLSSFWPLLSGFANSIGLVAVRWPPRPPGIDSGRPITFEVFAPRARFEAITLAAVRGAGDAGSLDEPPPVTVRVFLPASDPDALAGALVTAARLSLKELRKGEVFASSAWLLRVSRGPAGVAVDLAPGAGDPGDLDARFAMPAGAVVTRSLDDGGRSAIRAVVSGAELGELVAAKRAAGLTGSPGAGSRRERHLTQAAWIADVLSGYLLWDPDLSFATEVWFELPADGAPAPSIVAALSDAGVETLTTAGLEEGAPTPLLSLQWRKAISAAPRSPLLAGAASAEEGMELWKECDWYCAGLYGTLLGNALQMARVVQGHVDLDVRFAEAMADLESRGLGWSDLEGIRLTRRDRLLWIEGAGHVSDGTRRPPVDQRRAGPSCYRSALLAVRAGLHRDAHGERREALERARVALREVERCVAADPDLVPRYCAMSEVVARIAYQANLEPGAAAAAPPPARRDLETGPLCP